MKRTTPSTSALCHDSVILKSPTVIVSVEGRDGIHLLRRLWQKKKEKVPKENKTVHEGRRRGRDKDRLWSSTSEIGRTHRLASNIGRQLRLRIRNAPAFPFFVVSAEQG